MVTYLDSLIPGGSAVIGEVDTDARLQKRLLDFGMVPGTDVTCRYCSPGRHLMALECRGAVLAMRARDLRKIQVRD